MNPEQIAEKVLEMLQKQYFADWFTGRFEDFISGDMEYLTGKSYTECKAKILEDIQQLLRLNLP